MDVIGADGAANTRRIQEVGRVDIPDFVAIPVYAGDVAGKAAMTVEGERVADLVGDVIGHIVEQLNELLGEDNAGDPTENWCEQRGEGSGSVGSSGGECSAPDGIDCICYRLLHSAGFY